MNKVIRWHGLLAFVGVLAALLISIYLFAAPMLRFALTASFTRINGAEVNIAAVDVQWSPFHVALHGVEFTDPETPELNRFEAQQVSFSVELLSALIGRIYIDELTATGIAMGVAREKPGRVRADDRAERQAEGKTTAWGERFAAIGFDFPDVDALLERSEIRTPAVIETAQQRTRASRDEIEARRESLPSSDALDDYEQRFRQLRDARPRTLEEFEHLRTALSELREDLRDDRDNVQAFTRSIEEAAAQIQLTVQELRAAPGADLARVRQLIELDNDAISDIAGILFGPQIQQWTDYALIAYDFVAPLLQSEAEATPSRWEGRFIEFDDGSAPQFLIRLAHTSLNLADLDIELRWNNITWQHDRIGTPTSYALAVSQSPYWQSLQAEGNFYINEAIEFNGQQLWELQGAALTAQRLLEQADVHVDLRQAVLNSQGNIVINQGEFNGRAGINLQQVQLDAEGERTWARLLGDALTQIEAFDMDIGLQGRVGSPRLSIHSDLDNQLRAAFSGVMQGYVDEHLAEVRSQLESEVETALGDIQPRIEQINALRTLADNQDERLQSMLDEELDNLRDNALEQLKGRLGERLRESLGGN